MRYNNLDVGIRVACSQGMGNNYIIGCDLTAKLDSHVCFIFGERKSYELSLTKYTMHISACQDPGS